jgi:prepilin peptidase CpaA
MTASESVLAELFAILYCLLLVACAMTDFLWLRIPNLLVLALVASFLTCAALTDVPVSWLGQVLPALGGLGLGTVLFQFGKIGGGDVKLLAATMLWIGVNGLPIFLIWLAIAGVAVLLLFLIAWRHLDRSSLGLKARLDAMGLVPRSLAERGHIPYGIVIAIASIGTAGRVPFFAGII